MSELHEGLVSRPAAEPREQLLQRELDDSRLLHEISIEMIGEHDVHALYGRILDAATHLMRSAFASMQIVIDDPRGAELELLGHRNFSAEAVALWQRVRITAKTNCGTALRLRRRSVVADTEVPGSGVPAADLAMYRTLGIRSVQTTPLVTRSGELVGMLSTHWREVHEPSARELRLLDILARQAADLVEGRLAEAALRERERKYRGLFDAVGEGFCILERVETASGAPADYLCIEANPAFRRHSAIDEPVGRTVREAFPAQPDDWLPVFDEVLRNGRPARHEAVLGGDGRVFELNAFRVEDARARRIGVTFKDITRRRRSEAATALFDAIADDFARLSGVEDVMQAVGARVGAFLDLSTCLFIDIDAEQVAADVAHAWQADDVPDLRGGYRIADFVGTNLREALAGGSVVAIDDALSHPDTDAARFAWVGVRAIVSVPFHRDSRWRFTLALGDRRARRWRADEIDLCRELANRVFPRLERARAEQALRDSEERLRSADRRKDEFLATLAHELRNPLAPIRNALQLLRLAGPQMPPGPIYEMLERQVAHVVRLVDDLLEVSRVSRGAIDLKRERLELQQVLRVAVETSRPLIEHDRQELALALPDQPLMLDGDAVRLAQVFSNLLNNASKYTDAGGRITVEARSEGDCVIVAVRDSGIGIAAEQMPRLFEMFAQVDHARARDHGGLGIGLWLVRHLVEMHGGSVFVHSEGLGHGSCFTVRLPLAPAAAAPQRGIEHATAAHLALRRVLVVDDNRDAADSLGMLLELLGADVRIEHDGAGAIAALAEWRPSAVLLDLGMPGLSGYDVARHIRSDPAHRDVLLVAVTGWGQDADRARTRDAGFDHHLIKPVGIDVLQALLARVAPPRAAAGDVVPWTGRSVG